MENRNGFFLNKCLIILSVIFLLFLMACGNNENVAVEEETVPQKTMASKIVDEFCQRLKLNYTIIDSTIVSSDLLKDVWLVDEFDTYLSDSDIEKLVNDNINNLKYTIEKEELMGNENIRKVYVDFEFTNLCKDYADREKEKIANVSKDAFDNIVGKGMYDVVINIIEAMKEKGNKGKKLHEKVIFTVTGVDNNPYIIDISQNLKEVMSGGVYNIMKDNEKYSKRFYVDKTLIN